MHQAGQKVRKKGKKGILGGEDNPELSRCVQCNHWVVIREKGSQEDSDKAM